MLRVIVFICALVLGGCSVFTCEYRTVERMTWRAMRSDWHGMPGAPGAIVLTWESTPDHHIIINSPELLKRLQETGKPVVDVEFLAWAEFGKLRGFNRVLVDGGRFRKVLKARAEPQPPARRRDHIRFSAYSTENTQGSPCLSS